MKTSLGMAVLALTILSCGGGDGQSCSETAACGGEISPGRYKVASYCSSLKGTLKSVECPAGITIQTGNVSVSGTFTFNADKTYQSDATISATVVETIPASCLTQGSVKLTCAQLTEAIMEPGSSMKGSCTGSAGCTCNFSFGPEQVVTTGTWSTSGTLLTTTPMDGDPEQSPYCATPTSVTVSEKSMSSLGMTPDMDELMGTSSMVLTKE